ncbi:MAG: M20 aminoacylase family protein [Pikeienuella sp.]
MPIVNSITDTHAEITEWRRDFHRHPELQFDVHRTAKIVAEKLRAFGCDEVVEGIGRTGVVGIIRGRSNSSGKVIGMRADMDALPIIEASGAEHSSTIEGKMHACGHDGHTAMLLGAAKYLSETRRFDGDVALIFQPAEEGGAGGLEMVNDGMMDRFGVTEVYGMHNLPGLPVGDFAIRSGPLLASSDEFVIHLTGVGGHAARPNVAVDTTLVGAHIIAALQMIASRVIDPIEELVLSVTSMQTEGDAFNVIPQKAEMRGTVRCYTEANRTLAEEKLRQIVTSTAVAYGATAEVEWSRGYPATINHHDQAMFAGEVADDVAGEHRVNRNIPPAMPAEDFSYMLLERPGAMIMVGNGDSAECHHPAYDFADDTIPAGASFWARLAEISMPLDD